MTWPATPEGLSVIATSGKEAPLRLAASMAVGFVPAGSSKRRREQTLSKAEEYRHAIRLWVGHGNVWKAVAIEIGDGDGCRRLPVASGEFGA